MDSALLLQACMPYDTCGGRDSYRRSEISQKQSDAKAGHSRTGKALLAFQTLRSMFRVLRKARYCWNGYWHGWTKLMRGAQMTNLPILSVFSISNRCFCLPPAQCSSSKLWSSPIHSQSDLELLSILCSIGKIKGKMMHSIKDQMSGMW